MENKLTWVRALEILQWSGDKDPDEHVDGLAVKFTHGELQDIVQGGMTTTRIAERGRIEKAVKLAFEYGGIDGNHHKMWVIDQMLRILLGDKYKEAVAESCRGEDGPNTYEWETGTPP